jgi:hypothetical protein
VRVSFLTVLTLLAVFGSSQETFAAPRIDQIGCRPKAIHDLQELSPRGYAIYQEVKDKSQFFTWLTCDDVQTGLSTAVHESVHVLTEEQDAYPLIDGSSIRRPHEVSHFFAPAKIAGKFDAHDPYVQNYLSPSGASSKDDFMYLLDELNAYSHDLNSAVKLVSLQRHDRDIDRRDGLAAVMDFVMRYVDVAQKREPATWQGLLRPEPRRVVQTLWSQAETTLASSCGLPEFGLKDREYIGFICEQRNGGALAELLGRAPACPSECLSSTTASAR